MTNQVSSLDIRRYALAGAQARLAEMTQEADAIRRTFPELKENGTRGFKSAKLRAGDGDESAPTARRRRGKMSAAQRKAVGERMKKYWAARRAGNGAAVAAPTTRTAKAAGAARRGPRKMSAAGRKRISDAQKKRWAARRAKA